MAAYVTFAGVTTLCETMLCPKDDDEEYHHLDCIRGSCELCGISRLKLCPQELSMSSDVLVSWHRFEKVFVGRGEGGSDRHALRLEYKMRPPANLITALKMSSRKFLKQNGKISSSRPAWRIC